MVKLTVLYGHPTDADAFERYYAETHQPLVALVPGALRSEAALVVATPDGSRPPFYRIFEWWFESVDAFQAAMASPEGRAVGADVPNFATGGAIMLIADVA